MSDVNIKPIRVDLWLPLSGDDPPYIDELFRLLAGSAYTPEIPCAFVGDWWMCQGVVPDLAFLVLGMSLWAKAHGGLFRVLTPEEPAFPPEVAATLND